MALLQWKANYSIGIDAVDYEHRELIDLINRTHDEWLAGPRPAVEALLGDLYAGISAHFALEEHFMREHRYDRLSEHKSDHERLLDELREIMESFDLDPDASGALAARLDDWFSRHFETHDARLHHALGPHTHP